MRVRTSLKPLAWMLACAAGTLAVVPLAASAEDLAVKVGFAAPLTGANAGYGKDLENGVQLALDEANAKNIKIGGKTARFEIAAEDDQADPRVGVQAAQKLVDDGVAVVVGHFNSGTTLPASRVYENAGIPMIDPAATNPTITTQGFANMFTVISSDAQNAGNAGLYAVTTTKAKRIAIIDDRTAFGQGEADEFEKAVKVEGRHDRRARVQRQPDRRLQRAAHAHQGHERGPGVLRRTRPAGGGGRETDEAARHERAVRGRRRRDGRGLPEARGRSVRRRAGVGIRQPAGKAAARQGVRSRSSRSATASTILSYAPFGYDAAWAAVHAMQKANSIDPKVYRPALQKVSFDGITGPIAFDDKGALKNASSTLYQVKNGAWVPVVTKSGM